MRARLWWAWPCFLVGFWSLSAASDAAEGRIGWVIIDVALVAVCVWAFRRRRRRERERRIEDLTLYRSPRITIPVPGFYSFSFGGTTVGAELGSGTHQLRIRRREVDRGHRKARQAREGRTDRASDATKPEAGRSEARRAGTPQEGPRAGEVAPDFAGTFLGYRCFAVTGATSRRPFLRSVYMGTEWRSAGASALCQISGGSPTCDEIVVDVTTFDQPETRELLVKEADHPPAAACACGIYALWSPSAAIAYCEKVLIGGPVVLACVEGWGKVIPGERGWRAEHVRITALVDGGEGDLVRRLADVYDVALISAEDFAALPVAGASFDEEIA